MVEPGWYPDPAASQPGQLRWWDGTDWTDDTVLPAASPPEPATGAPAGGFTAPAAASTTPFTPPGQPTPPAGIAAGPYPPVAPARANRGCGLAILVLVVVLAIGGLVLGLIVVSSDSGPTTGAPPVDTGSIVALNRGDAVPFSVGRNGTWTAIADIPAGRMVLDVRGVSGFDPVTTVYDAQTGSEVAYNDDRNADQLAQYGGDRYDSLIDVDLPAGRYLIEVRGFGGRSGAGQLLVQELGG